MSAVHQVKHFVVPVFGGDDAEDALNRFLRNHAVLEVHRELWARGTDACWCFSVRYGEGDTAGGGRASGARRARVDYKDELEPEAFARFAELRKRRKAIAEQESLPAFAVFTDEELAGIARLTAPDLKALMSVKGIGPKKVERFGARILDSATSEENGDAKSGGAV
jgi:superfamily II DNA helicase RecQ